MTNAKLPPPADFDESPELTDEDFARMRPAREALPEILGAEAAAALMNKGGRPKAEATKVSVTMRLDPDVLEHFRSTGRGWQTRINETLRTDMERSKAAR